MTPGDATTLIAKVKSRLVHPVSLTTGISVPNSQPKVLFNPPASHAVVLVASDPGAPSAQQCCLRPVSKAHAHSPARTSLPRPPLGAASPRGGPGPLSVTLAPFPREGRLPGRRVWQKGRAALSTPCPAAQAGGFLPQGRSGTSTGKPGEPSAFCDILCWAVKTTPWGTSGCPPSVSLSVTREPPHRPPGIANLVVQRCEALRKAAGTEALQKCRVSQP